MSSISNHEEHLGKYIRKYNLLNNFFILFFVFSGIDANAFAKAKAMKHVQRDFKE